MSPERGDSPNSACEQEMSPSSPSEADAPSALMLAVCEYGQSSPEPGQQPQDDDLTSLSWLQDRNLLKGMNLSKSESEESKSDSNQSSPVKPYLLSNQSPTSDYIDESSVSAADSSSSSLNSPIPYTPRSKHPYNIPYDPLVHTTTKPPYSFSCLIFMAIEDSKQKALPVKEIYAWILDHFPYFRNAPTGWKNSVRHNLSLNKCFQKVEKNLGKGSLWMVDQQFRPNLLQALTRSPFHPCSKLDPKLYFPIPRANPPQSEHKSSHRLPDPELFPFLSRRLAATEANNDGSDDSLDDMDAAAVMLALKHGPRVLKEKRRRPSMVQVITTSPSEDHTYSAANSHGSHSPDEAFESDDSGGHHSADTDEQRQIAEGADALLNLAGIAATYKKLPQQNVEPRRGIKKPRLSPEPPERPTHFRPRLLRAKRKVDSQKRKTYNNNNESATKKSKSHSTHDEWVKHRKAMEESNRNSR